MENIKKILLSLAICLPAALTAQNGVTVSNLMVSPGVNPGTPSTVTFDIQWAEADMPSALWSDTVWVFVDYNKDGVMQRLPSTLGGTLTTHTGIITPASPKAGTVQPEPGNEKGLWVIGDARTNSANSFSAKVEMYTNEKNLAGACAYGSSYPPVGEWVSPIKVLFTGTPMYEITLNDSGGNPVTVKSNGAFLLPCDYAIDSFTDATGAPSKFIKCMPMTIGISVPDNIAADISTTFMATQSFSANAATTYTWSAPDFDPPSGTEASYVAKSPATTATYNVTLKVQSPGYCDTETSKTVTVVNCLDDDTEIHNLKVSSTTYCAGGKVTFALEGTTAGRTYQLYKHGHPVMNILDGTGSAETFTGTMEGGHYDGVYTAGLLFDNVEGKCSAVMNGSYTVIEHPLPANPVGINGASCKPPSGSVPVTISASSPGATITWYTTKESTSSVVTGETYTPSISSYSVFYAQAEYATGCISAARMAVSAELKNPPSANDLTLTSDVTTICNGMPTSIILTAVDGFTGAGAEYEWGTGSVPDDNLLATTPGNTWTVSPDAATTYWVRLRGTGVCSDVTTSGKTVSIGTYTAVSPGTITIGSTTTLAGTNPNVTIGSNEPASGGSGSYTYQWVRTNIKGGTPAAHNDQQATYTIAASDYNTAGTYRFTRRVQDAVCTNTSFVTAANSYTLSISPQTKSCPKCCWNGSAGTGTFVDCTITAQAYPFRSTDATYVIGVTWMGGGTTHYSGAAATYSDVDGRRNTTAITGATGISAVQICKDLGTGWYLPAYEELINMSTGTGGYTPMNVLLSLTSSGADLLIPRGSYYYWSSSEDKRDVGKDRRTKDNNTFYNDQAVLVKSDGAVYSATKTWEFGRVYCAYRP